MNNYITVSILVAANIQRVWELWTKPEHIIQWCAASDDWYVPVAQNDLQLGGRFVTTMAARDGSSRFNVSGIYTVVDPYARIAYTLDDGRKVDVRFAARDSSVEITETFEPENVYTHDQQREGWQSILSNFKRYVESTYYRT